MIMDQFDRVTVYQGDALAILDTLPAGSVDAVLTDPPYSSGGITLTARQSDPVNKYQQSGTRRQYPPMLGDAKDQRSWTHWCMLWLAECWRVSRDGAPLMVFTDWRQLPALTDAVQGAGWRWLALARHSALGQALCQTPDGTIPSAVRVCDLCVQRPFVQRHAGVSAGPLLAYGRGGTQGAPDQQACGAHARPAGHYATWRHGAGPVHGRRLHRRCLPRVWTWLHRYRVVGRVFCHQPRPHRPDQPAQLAQNGGAKTPLFSWLCVPTRAQNSANRAARLLKRVY